MIRTMHLWSVALALVLLISGPKPVSGSDPARTRELFGCGVTDAVGGWVSLQAVLGQPVVGAISSGDGQISLEQGFQPSSLPRYVVHLPLLLRDFP
ncbi:MAG: hypothetical protein JXA89_19760 [Anaerolineae bacterium]|nr:hypothetical protein [Anaerolineae bacterium]